MKRTMAVGAALVLLGVAAWRSGAPASAQAVSGFTLEARADSVGVHPVLSDAPLLPGGDVGFVTPASAQASLDSLQRSEAFASAPYAGDFVTTLPGTVNGLGGGKLPRVEAFPFYVSSEVPSTPSASWSVGPYGVSATSSADRSTGTADIGLGTTSPEVASVHARSDVSADPKTGVLTAAASTSIEPLSITPLIKLGDIHSTATLVYDPAHPDAPVKKTSSISIGTIDVAGTELGLTDRGLVAGRQTLVPIDLKGLSDLLSPLGVKITFVPSTQTATSITSAAVSVTYTTQLPSVGTTTITAVLGQVSATVDPQAPFASTPTPPVTMAPVGESPSLGSTAPVLPPPAIVSSPPSVVSAPARPVVHPSVVPIVDVHRIYPVLILAGAMVLVVSQLPVPRRRRRARSGGDA